MRNVITAGEVRKGDSIKVRFTVEDTTITREGIVGHITQVLSGGHMFRTARGYSLGPTAHNACTIQLLSRPTRPLPTQPGSVIIADRITGLGTPHTALALRHDGWWVSLQTGRPFAAASIAEWTAAKVVEA